jgi:hypothetical protein
MRWSLESLEPHSDPVVARLTAALWFGALGGPVAWFMQLCIVYGLAQLACYGVASPVTLHVASALCLLVALAATFTSYREHRLARGRWPTDRTGGLHSRVEFMSAFGILSGALFALVIVANWIAVILLKVCPSY